MHSHRLLSLVLFLAAFIIIWDPAIWLFRHRLPRLRHVFNVGWSIIAPLLGLLLLRLTARELLELLLLELILLLMELLRIRILPELLRLLLFVAHDHIVAHIHHDLLGGFVLAITASIAVSCAIGACSPLRFGLHLLHIVGR